METSISHLGYPATASFLGLKTYPQLSAQRRRSPPGLRRHCIIAGNRPQLEGRLLLQELRVDGVSQ